MDAQTVSPTYPFHKNGPALDRLWSGIFEVPDLGIITEEMTAHPSSKVSRKALEFSKKMNSKLQFKLLPRSKGYPDIFRDSCPDRDDIALYFYPARVESSRKQYSGPTLEGRQQPGAKCQDRRWQYAQLLKHMEDKDLMMRSRIDGIDLLVFPSRILQEDSQMLIDSSQMHCYFMWGVFCSRKG